MKQLALFNSAGQDAGCEAAIHAMRSLFAEENTEAILLVDASNTFNSLIRQVALRNISILCPSLAVILINTYRAKVPLFIDGKHLFSSEGTTQGNPLAMAMHAISVVPLIDAVRDCEIRQAWFADDATAAGSDWVAQVVVCPCVFGSCIWLQCKTI